MTAGDIVLVERFLCWLIRTAQIKAEQSMRMREYPRIPRYGTNIEYGDGVLMLTRLQRKLTERVVLTAVNNMTAIMQRKTQERTRELELLLQEIHEYIKVKRWEIDL